ncbi:MAG: ribosome maturation factor RimP [Acidobacteria bacterium]|nr:ribosome maturation factor RimP [Acidobacteriota bacterium]
MNVEKVGRLIQEATDLCQVELYHFEWLAGGRHNILRVYIDRPGGVTVADCERVSRELGVLLDVEDPIPQRYTLEVSSPGLDRRLYTPAHLRDCVGKEVELKLRRAPAKEPRKWHGILTAVDEAAITVECEGSLKRFPHDEIEWTRLRVNF